MQNVFVQLCQQNLPVQLPRTLGSGTFAAKLEAEPDVDGV